MKRRVPIWLSLGKRFIGVETSCVYVYAMSSRKASSELIQLIDQQSVRCKACKRELQYQHCLNHVCDALNVLVVNPQTLPAPPQNPQVIAPAPLHTIEDAFAEIQQEKLSEDVTKLSTAAVKLLIKGSTDGTARLAGPGKTLNIQNTDLPQSCRSR